MEAVEAASKGDLYQVIEVNCSGGKEVCEVDEFQNLLVFNNVSWPLLERRIGAVWPPFGNGETTTSPPNLNTRASSLECLLGDCQAEELKRPGSTWSYDQASLWLACVT